MVPGLAELWAAAQAYNATEPERAWLGGKLDERSRGAAELAALRRAGERFARERDGDRPEGFADALVEGVRHAPRPRRPPRIVRWFRGILRRDPRGQPQAQVEAAYRAFLVDVLADKRFTAYQSLLTIEERDSATRLAELFMAELVDPDAPWAPYFLDEFAQDDAREATRRKVTPVRIAVTIGAVALVAGLAAAIREGDSRVEQIDAGGVAVAALGVGGVAAIDTGARRRALRDLHRDLVPVAAALTGRDLRQGEPVLSPVLEAARSFGRRLDHPGTFTLHDVSEDDLDRLPELAAPLRADRPAWLDRDVGDALRDLDDAVGNFAGDPDERDLDYARALIALVTVLGEVESQLWGATTGAQRAA